MKRSATISVRLWLLFATTLALLAGALVARMHGTHNGVGHDADLPAMRLELASLMAPNAAELARWRERHAGLLAKRWTASARAALEVQFGSRWRWVQAADDSATRTYALHAVAPESLPWSAVVAVLAALEAAPGATVEAITIATAGTRTARNFAAVEIHVRLQWAEAGTGNTVPPESVRRDRVLLGPVWPGTFAEGRARCGRSLPSASAEPPAPVRSALRPARPPATRPVPQEFV
ncbi:MAG: hypothetical protein Q7S40_34150 [Opitutaceae bacterium]|nr:hypothetical protein [Opitutaceae bacterium]